MSEFLQDSEPLYEFAAQTNPDDWAQSLESRKGAKAADTVGNTLRKITRVKLRWVAAAALTGALAYAELHHPAPPEPTVPAHQSQTVHDICVDNLPKGLTAAQAMNAVSLCHDRQLMPGNDGLSN